MRSLKKDGQSRRLKLNRRSQVRSLTPGCAEIYLTGRREKMPSAWGKTRRDSLKRGSADVPGRVWADRFSLMDLFRLIQG